MNTCIIARQPVLDAFGQLHGHELFFRMTDIRLRNSGAAFVRLGGQQIDSLGVERLTRGRRVFIKVTPQFLLARLPLPLQGSNITLVCSSTDLARPEIVDAIINYRLKGLQVAMDVDSADELTDTPIQGVDVVRFRSDSDVPADPNHWARQTKGGIILKNRRHPHRLAELGESGVKYMQGAFDGRVPPGISEAGASMKGSEVLHLLSRVLDPTAKIQEIESLVKADPVLTVRLLQCVNSAMYRRRRPVDSLREALAVLGMKHVARWVSILSMRSFEHFPASLIHRSLLRAKMTQLLCEDRKMLDAERAFTVGLIYGFDQLLLTPIEEILSHLPLSQELEDAILKQEGALGEALKIVLAYERLDWDFLDAKVTNPETIHRTWVMASDWVDEVSRIGSNAQD